MAINEFALSDLAARLSGTDAASRSTSNLDEGADPINQLDPDTNRGFQRAQNADRTERSQLTLIF